MKWQKDGVDRFTIIQGDLVLTVFDQSIDFKRERVRAVLFIGPLEYPVGTYADVSSAKVSAPRDAARLLREWAAGLEAP